MVVLRRGRTGATYSIYIDPGIGTDGSKEAAGSEKVKSGKPKASQKNRKTKKPESLEARSKVSKGNWV